MVIAIRSTAIGAFSSCAQAEMAIRDVLGKGFGAEQVGIVLPDDGNLTSDWEGMPPASIWVGAMFRSRIGEEIPADEIRYYEEALQEGRTLVMVRAGDRFLEAIDILHRCGGQYMAAF
jgi:hypothetical protein